MFQVLYQNLILVNTKSIAINRETVTTINQHNKKKNYKEKIAIQEINNNKFQMHLHKKNWIPIQNCLRLPLINLKNIINIMKHSIKSKQALYKLLKPRNYFYAVAFLLLI